MQKKSTTKSSYTILMGKLKQIRVGSQMTQEDFAELLGISYKYYQRIETGKQADLRFSTLDKFAQALGVAAWQLVAPKRINLKINTKAKGSPHYRRNRRRHKASE